MNKAERIKSIISCYTINCEVFGLKNFLISELIIGNSFQINIPENLRLGHQVEKVVSGLIKQSTNFDIIYENLQIFENKITIGEIDFILKNRLDQQIIHLELVYKFYVYDQNISVIENECWIGPNRKDSYIEKINKLKNQQLPLLYHKQTQLIIEPNKVGLIKQKVCFMANLFLPKHNFNPEINSINPGRIKGFWLKHDEFINDYNPSFEFYLPAKKSWGIDPKFNKDWRSFDIVKSEVRIEIIKNRSPLVWVKSPLGKFEEIFVVWW